MLEKASEQHHAGNELDFLYHIPVPSMIDDNNGFLGVRFS